MTQNLLDYLKRLCMEHVDFNHNESTDPAVRNLAYFEFDYVKMQESKKRNKYVLFINKLQGKYIDNRGDFKQDQAFVTATFAMKMGVNNNRKFHEIPVIFS